MEMLDKVLVTREEAREMGLVSYFTGLPCRNNHIDLRYTNTVRKDCKFK